MEEEKQKLQEEKLLERIGEIQAHTASKLNHLRFVREEEKKAKKQIKSPKNLNQSSWETKDG